MGYKGYLDDDGVRWKINVRGSNVEGWNPEVSLLGNEIFCSVWKNRKEYGLRPRTAYLQRFDAQRGKTIITAVPVYTVSAFAALVVGASYPWKGLQWQLVATRVELSL